MKIFILGSKGSMGRRYMAICKWLGHDAIGYDPIDSQLFPPYECLSSMDRFIIATPTDSHLRLSLMLISFGKPILCEKPVTKQSKEIQVIISHADHYSADVRMVCNYKFAWWPYRIHPNTHQVIYRNYHTGNDGLLWDLIQLIYIANGKVQIDIGPPQFRASCDGIRIGLDHIARSYVDMVRAWIDTPQELWDLKDAYCATKKVEQAYEEGTYKEELAKIGENPSAKAAKAETVGLVEESN